MLKPLCFSDVGCLLSLTGPRLQLAFGCSEFLQALMDEETDERAGHEEGKGRLNETRGSQTEQDQTPDDCNHRGVARPPLLIRRVKGAAQNESLG